MENTKLAKYETVLGRKLEEKEVQKLDKLKDIFKIQDNDALWDIILIMEYYTRICEDVPQKIEGMLSALPVHTFNNLPQTKSAKIKIQMGIGTLKLITYSLFLLYSGFILSRYQIDNIIYPLRILLLISLGILFVYYVIMSVNAFMNTGKIDRDVLLNGLLGIVVMGIGLGVYVL